MTTIFKFSSIVLEVWGTKMNKIVTVFKELLFVREQPLNHLNLINGDTGYNIRKMNTCHRRTENDY